MSVVTAIIKSKGKEISGTYELLSIDVTNEFNKIPKAELTFIDGDISKKEFKILDDTSFNLGKQITIAIKYEERAQEETKIFSGIVVNKVFELNGTNPTLTIEISDVTIKMHSHRKNKVYTEVADVQIYKSLLKQNGLEQGILENTPGTHQQMIQYYTTDWDFMLSRAEANAQLISIYDGTVSVFKPSLQKQAPTLELGLDEIYDFELQISADQQYDKVQTFAWDITKNKLTQPTQGSDYKLSQKNIDIPEIAQTMGTEKAMLMTAVPATSTELKLWSSAQLLKSRLSLIKGWVKIPGTGKIKVGDILAIKDFSKTFSGKNIVSAVRQEVTVDGWDTYLQIGMEACWFTASNKVMDQPAAGLLPGVNGLQIGIVQSTERDPDNLHRIKVTIPAFGEKQTVWARLTTLDAGANRGTFFIPQPNDEVIVGFLNDDPRHAIIMGSVYNPINKPPLPFDTHPKSKGIFTQSNFQLFLDEEKQCITIATSDKNRIIIDEKQKRIELSDSHGNQIELNKKGIDILSAKDCKIMSKGDLKIQANGSVVIKGKTVDII